MVLFVCYTNLQLVIASRIIAEKRMSPLEVEVFYISKVNNDVTRNTLNDIRGICRRVTFIYMKYKYPLYFLHIFIHFIRRDYHSIFVASIDNILVHFILSRVSFKNLYTFDDGSANIIPYSIYYQSSAKNNYIKIIRWLFRIQHDMSSIKRISQIHYTIYNGFKNIIPNTISIRLLSHCNGSTNNDDSKIEQLSCNVIVGSVYDELFTPNTNIEKKLDNCWSILKSTGRRSFYLPHPRERNDISVNCIDVVRSKYIAEREIANLLKSYKEVYLYGFLSSCQINLANDRRVINNVFYSNDLSPVFRKSIIDSPLVADMNVIVLD
ncbi:glycosyltransferase family 52 [Aeromonas veronii]|uniref:glycosyltransferase family 52 n=1 Tax=Aeromonas veronii TaxID=654 RepID=UPI003D255F43